MLKALLHSKSKAAVTTNFLRLENVQVCYFYVGNCIPYRWKVFRLKVCHFGLTWHDF